MKDKNRPKGRLINELIKLRQHNAELEASEIELNKAEETLQESREWLKNIYEESPIGIALYDADGQLLDENKACLDIFGISDIADIKGFKLFKDPNVTDEIKERLRKGETVRYEASFDFEKVKKHKLYKTAKSGIIYIDVLITPLRLKGKECSNDYMVQIQDITERKKIEEKLKQHRQKLEASEKELKNFSRKILSIREEEKKNLSTVLHDEVGCMAVVLSSKLDAIEQEIKDNTLKDALKTIAKSKSALKKSVSSLKKIASNLRPPDLNIIGLPGVLRECFADIIDHADIEINFLVDLGKERINDNVGIILYRIIQEAFNNIIMHANANNVKVTLYSRRNEIKLNICDNGKGFDIEKNSKKSKEHLGIRGMREMAESLDGIFKIKSAPGKGADISITLPTIIEHKS